MSLREKLIEAGAEALDGMPAALLGAAAGVVLDAFLDCLAENVDETVHTSYDDVAAAWRLGDVAAEDLLAVLRSSDV